MSCSNIIWKVAYIVHLEFVYAVDLILFFKISCLYFDSHYLQILMPREMPDFFQSGTRFCATSQVRTNSVQFIPRVRTQQSPCVC